MALAILVAKLIQKNVAPFSSHWQQPKRMVETPVRRVPAMKPFLFRIRYLPKSGEKIMVITKTELKTCEKFDLFNLHASEGRTGGRRFAQVSARLNCLAKYEAIYLIPLMFEGLYLRCS